MVAVAIMYLGRDSTTRVNSLPEIILARRSWIRLDGSGIILKDNICGDKSPDSIHQEWLHIIIFSPASREVVVLEDSPDYYIQNHMWPRERIIGSSPSIVIANPANYVLLVWIIELKGVHPTQNPCSSDHGGGEQDRRGLIRNFLCLVDLLVASSDDSLLRHGRESIIRTRKMSRTIGILRKLAFLTSKSGTKVFFLSTR